MLTIAARHSLLELIQLFVDLVPDPVEVIPLKAGFGRLLGDGHGSSQGWHAADLLGQLVAERAGGVAESLSPFSSFDRFPAAANRLAVAGLVVPEDVGVTTDQFRADGPCDGIEVKTLLLPGDLGMQYHLQQQVPQFLLELAVVAVTDGIGDLVGFLEHVGHERGVGLFQIPWAAPVGIAQVRHNIDQLLQSVLGGRGHACRGDRAHPLTADAVVDAIRPAADRHRGSDAASS